MQKDNRFFDDLAKMASGAAGSLLEIRREIEVAARSQVEKILGHMNLVTREEFDAVRQMAEKARMEQEKLKARLDALEKGK